MTEETLLRIAAALERIAPAAPGGTDWAAHPAYVWDRAGGRGVPVLAAPELALLRGIEDQKAAVVGNVRRHAEGHAAHDMLLWGSRGMGKSALLRAAVLSAQGGSAGADTGRIALVQVAPDALSTLTALFLALGKVQRRFLVYIDDLGFEDGDSTGPRQLRSWLEGGVEARPANVRLAVTANRRAIVSRHLSEQDDPINPRDVVDDRLALADRFGLSVGFHACNQEDYLAIITGYAEEYGLAFDPHDALEWSKRRGARSGRVAWQYVTELAGRSGRALPAR
jgi:predicted AAA+ superfamily ATPase